MAYKIAFIGYNEEQTRNALDDLVHHNADQIASYDRRRGVVKLQDGTTIYKILAIPGFLAGRYFDQAIVADDRRRLVYKARWLVLYELAGRMECSEVPKEFRWMFYDLDAEVAP